MMSPGLQSPSRQFSHGDQIRGGKVVDEKNPEAEHEKATVSPQEPDETARDEDGQHSLANCDGFGREGILKKVDAHREKPLIELVQEQRENRPCVREDRGLTGEAVQKAGSDPGPFQERASCGEGDPKHQEESGQQPGQASSSRQEKQEQEPMEKRGDIPALLRKHGQEQAEQRGGVQKNEVAASGQDARPAQKGEEGEERTEEPGLIRDDADGFHVSGMKEEQERTGDQGGRTVGAEGTVREKGIEQEEEECGVAHVQEQTLEAVRQRKGSKGLVAQGMKQNGHGTIVGEMNAKVRTARDMEVTMAEQGREVPPFKGTLGGVVQDETVLIPQERTEKGLTVKQQAEDGEHQEQKEQKGGAG